MPLDQMKKLSNMLNGDGYINTVNNAGHFVPEWGMEFSEQLFVEISK